MLIINKKASLVFENSGCVRKDDRGKLRLTDSLLKIMLNN